MLLCSRTLARDAHFFLSASCGAWIDFFFRKGQWWQMIGTNSESHWWPFPHDNVCSPFFYWHIEQCLFAFFVLLLQKVDNPESTVINIFSKAVEWISLHITRDISSHIKLETCNGFKETFNRFACHAALLIVVTLHDSCTVKPCKEHAERKLFNGKDLKSVSYRVGAGHNQGLPGTLELMRYARRKMVLWVWLGKLYKYSSKTATTWGNSQLSHEKKNNMGHLNIFEILWQRGSWFSI